MGCHIAKSFSQNSQKLQQQKQFQQPHYFVYRENPNIAAAAALNSLINMDNNNEINADTQPQTQSQSTNAWTNVADSQPIENVVWGRLYPKSVKLKSLDLCQPQFAAGRDEANDMCLTKRELPDKILCRISKVHFRIEKDLTDVTSPVYIQDLSRNGTFVNGSKIGYQQRQLLLNDDTISLSHPQYKAFIYKDLSPNEAHGLPPIICSRYHIGRKLGAGACGVVRLVYDRRTCEPFAMKHIKKTLTMGGAKAAPMPQAAANDTRCRIDNEGQIMRSLRHPCVVRMHDIIDQPDSVFIMLELMQGGDLLTRIIGRKRLSEATSKLYFVQLCHAVKYLHDKHITHRDLKPDNVLLQTDGEETLLKVSDFGLSKSVDNAATVMRTLCGTPLYVAPEVLLTGGREAYTSKVDIWSLGVVLFTCLSGTLPFSDEYGTLASEQIKKGQFAYRSPAWGGVSAAAKALINTMLTVAAEKRPDINAVLADAWLQDEECLQRAAAIMKVPVAELMAAGKPASRCRRLATATRPMSMPTTRRTATRTTTTSVAANSAEEAIVKCVVNVKLDTPDSDEQENVEANFMQPPAAKRRRIEQM